MKGILRLAILPAAALALTLIQTPARAQTAGLDFLGGGDGQANMMTQMAPMLDMMKKKLGRKRFGQLMKTVGPLATQMMGNGNGGFGNFGGMNFNTASFGGLGDGGGLGGFDMGSLGGLGGFDLNAIQSFMPRHGGRKRH